MTTECDGSDTLGNTPVVSVTTDTHSWLICPQHGHLYPPGTRCGLCVEYEDFDWGKAQG